jgi:hypothetical protein
MVGETVLDFAGLIGIDGYRFIDQVAVHYDLPLGDSFDVKLEWLCRTLTLTWLAEGAACHPDEVSKRLSWVADAFDHPRRASERHLPPDPSTRSCRQTGERS